MPKIKCKSERVLTTVLALLLLTLVSIPVFAQLPTGTILGVVKDSTGGTVAGATVTVTNADTGAARTGTTGDDGAYRFPALAVGNYQIQVMKDGFQTAQRKGITLEVTQEAAIDFTLQVGSTRQTVVVTEEAPQVNTTSSTTGGLVTEQSVADLPLNGRNYVDLTLMQAGVTQSTVFASSAVNATNITGVTFTSNGAPIHSNNYILDGAIQTSVFSMNNASIIGTTLGVDGIKEYKVVASLPSADFGLVMGATSTIVSKSGTNSFHGDAYDYLRNSSLDARNYFDATDTLNFNGFGTNKTLDYPNKRIPPFQRNNFGAAGGGPIIKDKLFFYAVYEGLRQYQGETITTETLPGACFDTTPGSPTYHQVTAIPGGFNAANGGTLLNVGCAGSLPVIGGAQQTVNPYIVPYLRDSIFPGQVGLFPFPNANIDSSVLGNQLPAATFNYTFPYKRPSTENFGQMRIDYNLSAADSFFARYTKDSANQEQEGAYPQIRNHEHSDATYITLSETHILSPTVLNTFRFSFSRTFSHSYLTTTTPITDRNVLLTADTIDLGSFAVGSNVGTPTINGNTLKTFTVSGWPLSPAYGDFPQNIFTYSDDVFWTKGKHAFKFGVLVNAYQSAMDFSFNDRGGASFNNLTQFAYGDYLTLTTLGGTLYPKQSRFFVNNTFGFYAQDDFRASSKLTLNLGLRYEFSTVPREFNGNDYTIQNLLTANGQSPTQGAVRSRIFLNPSLHSFSPRIGFAYDPFGKGNMSIRGGAGLYYDIGNYGAFYLEQACCGPPSDFFVITNNNNTTPPYTFSVPLPTSIGSGRENDPTVKAAIALPSPRNDDYHKKQPSMVQYNLTIDRQLPWNLGLTAGYVGSRGWHLDINEEGNPKVPLGYLPNGLPYFCDVAIHPASADQSCAGNSNPASPFFVNRQNPTFGAINLNASDRDSWYNSLQIGLNKRISHGLQFGTAYTWSKLLDNGQSQQPGESTSIRAQSVLAKYLDRGLAGFDVASNLRFNVLYHAPNVGGDHFYAKPLHGWWMSSIVSLQSGYGFSPTISPNRSFTNSQSGTDRPNLAANYDPSKLLLHTVQHWFDASMFAIQPAGTLGNAPRDTIRGPGLTNWDFSINKDTAAHFLGEQGAIQFRLEVFNVLNHPNFGAPNPLISSFSAGTASCGGQVGAASVTCNGVITNNPFPVNGASGAITSTANKSRQMQLALKVVF